jgi:O-antigen/teichoic acid export membrane protein
MDSDELLKEISFESSKSVFGALGTKALNYVLIILLARYLQPSGYGVYATGFMIASVITTMSQFGLRSGMTRFISRAIGESNREIIPTIYLSVVVIAAGSTTIIVTAALMISPLLADLFLENTSILIILLFLLSVPFRVLLVVTMGLFDGFNDNGIRVAIQIARNFLQVTVVFVLALSGASLEMIVLGTVSVIALSALFTAGLTLRRLFNIGFRIQRERAKGISKDIFIYSFPLWFVALSNLGMNWADILLLSFFTTSDVVGIYQSAYSLSSGFQILLLAFATPFFPMASRLYSASNFDQLERLFQTVTRWNNLVMLPAFVFTFVFAESVITLMFGDAYAGGVLILQALLVGAFVNVFSGNNIVILKSSNNTRVYLVISGVTMALNLVLNLTLIPRFQGVGAAVATSASLILLNIGVIAFVYYQFGIWGYRPLRSYLTYLSSAGIALIPIIAANQIIGLNIVVLSLTYAGLYFSLIHLQKGYTDVEKSVMSFGKDRLVNALPFRI